MINSCSSDPNSITISFELYQEKLNHFRFHRPKTEFIVSRARERKNVT